MAPKMNLPWLDFIQEHQSIPVEYHKILMRIFTSNKILEAMWELRREEGIGEDPEADDPVREAKERTEGYMGTREGMLFRDKVYGQILKKFHFNDEWLDFFIAFIRYGIVELPSEREPGEKKKFSTYFKFKDEIEKRLGTTMKVIGSQPFRSGNTIITLDEASGKFTIEGDGNSTIQEILELSDVLQRFTKQLRKKIPKELVQGGKHESSLFIESIICFLLDHGFTKNSDIDQRVRKYYEGSYGRPPSAEGAYSPEAIERHIRRVKQMRKS